MFQGIKNGSGLIYESFRAFIKYPRMLIPLLICWSIYAPMLVYLKFHLPWEEYAQSIQHLIAFSYFLILSVIFSWSAFFLLELIRQIEMDEKQSFFAAFFVSIKNTIIGLPIALMWAIIWFVITVIECMIRGGSSSDDDDDEYNAENVAKTVAGYEEFSLSRAFFQALKKAVRMAAFLILPAIAWEKLNTSDSIKKGLGIAKTHKAEFATGFILTEMAAFIVFLPPAILFYINGKFDVEFADEVWYGLMVYCSFAWSFSLYLEQMFVSELYLWHLIWEKEKDVKGEELKLEDVKRPSVMDNVADLLLTNASITANKSKHRD